MGNVSSLGGLINDPKYDPVIDIVDDKSVKISGLWSENDPDKKWRAEFSITKYSSLFQEFHDNKIDVHAFFDTLLYMKPAETDLQELFDALQLFPVRKEGKEIVNGGKVTTTASLQPVQDQETIDTIKAMIMSLDGPTDTSMSSNILPVVADVAAGEENSDVPLAGTHAQDNTEA